MIRQILLVLFFAAVAGLALAVSRYKGYAVDEVEHVHAAYNISDGRVLYADFWEAHPPALYVMLQPVVKAEDAVGSFKRSRAVLYALLILHLSLIGYCGYKLAGKAGGFLAAGFAGLHSTMIERGIEVRPDGPMSLCVTAALALELSGLGRLRRYCLQGLLLGMAVLLSQKAVFACLAFGCLWLLAAIRNRSAKLVVLPMVAWTVPLVVGAAGLALTGSLDDFWTTTVVASARAAARSEGWMRTFGPSITILAEGLHNPVFLIASAWAILAVGSASRKNSELVFPLWLALMLMASLWLNPFPFAYLHVTVIPALCVLIAYTVVQSFERHRLTEVARWSFVGIWMVLAGMFSVSRMIGEADSRLQAYQMDTLAEVQRITAPDEPVFDLAGLYFRPDAVPVFTMTKHMICRYIAGGYGSIPDAIRASETPVILTNYRTAWFSDVQSRESCARWRTSTGPADDVHSGVRRARDVEDFIADHYVPYKDNIRVLGTELEPGVRRSVEILKEAEYRFDGAGTLRLRGEPFVRGTLSKGVYDSISDSGGRLLLVTPRPWPDPGVPGRLYAR